MTATKTQRFRLRLGSAADQARHAPLAVDDASADEILPDLQGEPLERPRPGRSRLLRGLRALIRAGALRPQSHSGEHALLLGVGHHDAAVLVDQAPSHEIAKPLEGGSPAGAFHGRERCPSELFRIIPGHEPAHSAHVRPEDAEDARNIADGDLDA